MNKLLAIFKNMNLKAKFFTFFIVLLFAFLIFKPFLVYGVGVVNSGWRVNSGLTEKVVYYSNSDNVATSSTCIINSSSNDYFIPTKTYNEWIVLTTKMASRGMAPSTCPVAQSCSDGICDGNENTSNCPADCGSWTCGNDLIDPRDSKVYPTVQIGTQCWMAKNLNVGSMISSSVSPSVNCTYNSEGEHTPSNCIEKYCYQNIESNCDVYGGLYWWGEAVAGDYTISYGTNGADGKPAFQSVAEYRGVCPEGWHVPAYYEFTKLADYLGVAAYCGDDLKSTSFSGGSNTSGFSAISTPYCSSTSGCSFTAPGSYTFFWTSFHYISSTARKMQLDVGSALNSGYASVENGNSVRCIRDTIVSHSLTYTAGSNGNISGILSQTVEDGSSGTAVTASPHSGYIFVDWSDGVTTATRQETNVMFDISVTANFAIVSAYCGDTVCNNGEDSNNCPEDCGTPSLECPASVTFTDPGTSESVTYGTVIIGDQCWINKNLNIGTYINSSVNQTDNGVIEKYCFNNISSNCGIFGALYQFNEAYSALGGENICPIGWRLPAWSDINTLTDYAKNLAPNDQTAAGTRLKTYGPSWGNPQGNNMTGFSAVPTGYINTQGTSVGSSIPPTETYFWTLTTMSYYSSWYMKLTSGDSSYLLSYGSVSGDSINGYEEGDYGFSVRCIKEGYLGNP